MTSGIAQAFLFTLCWTLCSTYIIELKHTVGYGATIFNATVDDSTAFYELVTTESTIFEPPVPFKINRLTGAVYYTPSGTQRNYYESKNYHLLVKISVLHSKTFITVPLTIIFNPLLLSSESPQEISIQYSRPGQSLYEILPNLESEHTCPNILHVASLCSCKRTENELIGNLDPNKREFMQNIEDCNLDNVVIPTQTILIKVQNNPTIAHPEVLPKRRKRNARKRRGSGIRFQSRRFTAQVHENRPSPLPVKTMQVYDKNGPVESNVIYKLEAGADQRSLSMFEINTETGAITTQQPLDREQMARHVFTVTAKRGDAFARCTLTVNVLDVNDNRPIFEKQNGYKVDVQENAANGTHLTNLRATDADSGNNGQVSYRILRSSPPTKSFTIDSNANLLVNGLIDRELVPTYTLVVTAYDNGDPVFSSTLSVRVSVLDENDNYPQFTKSMYSVNVRENVQGNTGITSVEATDKDQGMNGIVTYELFGGNNKRKFSINSNTGEIFVRKSLDYEESHDGFMLHVRASDGGTPPLLNTSGLVRIRVLDINDNPPRFLMKTYPVTIPENTNPGNPVTSVFAADDDHNAQVTYSIISSQYVPFRIEPKSGSIFVSRKLDYETKQRYQFTVRASDNGSPKKHDEATVVVTIRDVNDNAPYFTETRYEERIAEDTGLGTEILRITAEDPDKQAFHGITYTLISGDTTRTFGVSTRGDYGSLTLQKKLDFNRKNRYKLTVRASDGSMSNTTFVYINVTDTNSHQPVFDQSTYDVAMDENVSNRTLVRQVHASDDDVGDNARITYCFTEPVSKFTIDGVTGEIRTLKRLDFETQRRITLSVKAVDNGLPQKEDFAVVVINLRDVNDNYPIFDKRQYTGSVSEGSDIYEPVVTIHATDLDSGVNRLIHYTFDNGDDGDGSFTIDRMSGTVRTAQLLDRESISQYRLVAFAVDGGTPPKSSSVTIIVKVLDVDDNPPRFQEDIMYFKVNESVKPHDVVARVEAVDPDLPDPNSRIRYRLDHDPVIQRQWDIDSDTGDLSTMHQLDYETKTNYTIVVIAMSKGLVSQTTVVILVQDCNDNDPVLNDFEIIFNNYRTGLSDSFPLGVIGRVPAYDPDVSDTLTYRFVAGNAGNLLLMNETSGELRLNSTLDSNRQYSVRMVIQVSDGLHTTPATCTLRVTGITDEMLQHSITVRILHMNAYTFLSPVMYNFTNGLAKILNISTSKIFIFNVQNDTDVSREVLNVSFSVHDNDGSFFPSKYLQDQVYLNRLTLTKLTSKNVLPFDDNICLREPCQNYKRCTSVLTFDSSAPFISSSVMIFRPIYPVYRLKCECPIGFTNDETCTDEVDLCYSSPCLNSGECVSKEGGYTCKCKRGFAGVHCEINLNKGQCVEHPEICRNGGKCLDTSSDSFSCSCFGVLGISNPSEETTSLCALRSRQFRRGNFLTLPGISNQWHFTLSLSFSTIHADGLLFYNGRLNHEHDFMTLELVGGQAQLNFSTGQSWTVVDPYVSGGLNDGQWHTVHIQYFNEPKPGPLPYGVLNRAGPSSTKIAVVTVDPESCDYMVAANWNSTFGSYSCSKQVKQTGAKNSLDLTSPLLLGGVPDLPEKYQVQSKSFDGCLRDLTIDGQLIDLGQYVANNGSKAGCSPMKSQCDSQVCNSGTCKPMWSNFRCLCNDDRTGRRCEHLSQFVAQLDGKGCVTYNNVREIPTFLLPWQQVVSFRTFQTDAIVMHIGIGDNSPIQIDVKLVGGHVFYVIKTRSKMNKQLPLMQTSVNDGQWHELAADWKVSPTSGQVHVAVYLDGSLEQAHIEFSRTQLQQLKISAVHVGGRYYQNRVLQPFKGCFQNLRLGSPPMHIIQSNSFTPKGGAQLTHGCSDPEKCTSSRCPTHSRCMSEWQRPKCVCNKGYVGKTCTSICDLDVCHNNGICQLNPDSQSGYICNCPRGFSGPACEQEHTEKCPTGWYGSSLCAPCNCSTSKNFDSNCDVKTGACSCKKHHYYVSELDICLPCKCYHLGSEDLQCNENTGQCRCREGISGRQCSKCTYKFSEITKAGCQVLDKACPRSLHSDIWWPQTRLNVRRPMLCPYGSVGTAARMCDAEHSWLEPDLSNCTSTDFHKFAVVLNKMSVNQTQLNTRRSIQLSSELDKATAANTVMYEKDVVSSYQIIRELLDYQSKQSDFGLATASDSSFTGNLVHATSSLFNNNTLSYWPVATNKSSTGLSEANLSAPLLVKSWEEYTSTLLENVNKIYYDSCIANSPNVYSAIKMVEPTGNDYVYGELDSNSDQQVVLVKLPKYLFKPSKYYQVQPVAAEKPAVAIITFKNLEKILPKKFEVDRTFRVPKQPMVNSILVTVQVYAENPADGAVDNSGPALVKRLDEPVDITFKLFNPKAIEPQCVYWNFTARGTGSIAGGWSQRGCTRTYLNSTHITCSCNHLTSFAVITDEEITSVLSLLPVRVTMVIAVSASLAFLFASIAASLFLPGVKSIRALINRNMAIAIFLTSFLYLIGIQQTSNIYLCMSIAVGLHFLLMSMFAWIFVDGVHLYRVLTEKRDINRGKMRVYYLLGWVLPAIITALSVGLEAKGYGNSLFCWISFDDLLIWSIVGPAILCCGVFFLLFFLSVQAYLSSKSTSMKREEILHELRSSFVLAPIIACTWAFALLAVNYNQALYCYVFSILCLIQSVLVFVFHCLLNREVKRAYQLYKERSFRKQGHNTTTQQLLRSSIGRTPDSSVRGGLPRFNNSTSESLSMNHITPQRRSPNFDSLDMSDSEASDGSYDGDDTASNSSMSLASSSGDDEVDMNTLQNIRNTRPQNNHVQHITPTGNGSSRTGQLSSSRVKFRSSRSDESLSNQSNETEF
uniref:Cadherin EGF LAG seven-pass G-type receptor 2 n=1 Tax=Phallusia mammillata TaxID=59560 RepID=A0A6F9D8D9_9ASCI|nr:cadherin EGF LAG seven-pass G-type receptor 2 [Phallusia mammillata]